jgi:hypothetical protein
MKIITSVVSIVAIALLWAYKDSVDSQTQAKADAEKQAVLDREQDREGALKTCLADAGAAKLDFEKRNATSHKNGSFTAPVYVFKMADQEHTLAVHQCQIQYGNH